VVAAVCQVRILKNLTHPHIIRLFEVVDEPYRRLIMMEYSSGGDLCRYVRDNRRLNESEAARLFVQIVDGLAYCHSCGIVHRDVKLDNLLLDDQRNIRIVDFGFSVSFQKGQKLRKACGSPSYAAPEIVARRPYAPAGVDVWSLGVVLYAMVCGYFPFQGSNNQDLCRKIVKGRFECPSFMSGECRDLVRLMLNVDPVKRISLDDCARHIWARSAYAKKPPIDPRDAPVCRASPLSLSVIMILIMVA
jgi:5'-AMP-activated protein kinase catalytic alpha subunit